ncbi:MAG: M20/M25/M40 family metallo-hydrolase [Rubrivivax sp.]|nr:MAG: M20/M25/M40 family metallo-hydrolase [Rubrivivax sp.]
MTDIHDRTDAWIVEHFDEQVRFLQELVRVPTDTPPGNNAPHADRTAELLTELGLKVEKHEVPAPVAKRGGMQSVTNLIVRHRFGTYGPKIALNAHGDVVPPGDGWTHDPYGAEIVYPSPTGAPAVPQGDAAGLGSGPAPRLVDGKLYGRASAVSKSDFATYTFALLALKNSGLPLRGLAELHFTYDEELGGELGPGWLLRQGVTRPDMVLCAGFSYQVVTAHNGCLQLEVTLNGQASHAAYPETGVDALQAANKLLTALYAHNEVLKTRRSEVPGITHPYLNVGRIDGGTNTNVVPGKVVLKLDRRIIPEESPAEVEAEVRALIEGAVAACPGVQVKINRLLLANAMKPLPGADRLVATLQKHGKAIFGEPIPTSGTPLYTDARLYTNMGIPAAIYGAGPRTVLESNAKRADEHLVLEDLMRATQVVARALGELLTRRNGEIPNETQA